MHIGSCEVGDKFLFLKLVEAEAVAMLHVVVVVLDVSDHAGCHLKLYILRGSVFFLFLYIVSKFCLMTVPWGMT